MNPRPGGIVFDHLKLGMVHAYSFTAKARLAKNDQLLAGGDHLLHVMQIEPSQGQRLAQSVRVWFLQRSFEDFFPASEAKHSRLGYLATQANPNVAFFVWKFRK